MASHKEEKCSYPVSEIKIQNSSGSSEKQTVVTEQQQFHKQQQPSTNGQTSERKIATERNDEKISFKLFKFPDRSEQYILEVHEITSDDVNSFHVKLENNGGEKWCVGMHKLAKKMENYDDLLEEDVNRPIFPKMNDFSLSERLSGWTMEKRKRKKGVVDKFYYHHKRQFRSLVEVAGFLLFSCKPKDLKPLTTVVNVPESREEEAATALILLSNVEAYDARGH